MTAFRFHGTDDDFDVPALRAENAQLRAALQRVRALCDAALPAGGGLPANHTLVVAEYSGGHQDLPPTERVFVRAGGEDDHDPGLYSKVFRPVGAEDGRPWAYGEVLWLDDPECDRGAVHLETYLPVEDVLAAIDPPAVDGAS